MDTPRHLFRKDNMFSLNPLASTFTSPYFMCPRVSTDDSEFGFDPHPAMASLPKYVSPCKVDHGGNTKIQIKVQQNDLLSQAGKKTHKPSKVAPPRDTETSSISDTSEKARLPRYTSSHSVRYGRLTPPMSTSSVSDNTPEPVKRSARNGASPRKSHLSQTNPRAASIATSYVSFSSALVGKPTTKASHSTGKAMPKSKPAATQQDDRKRKLSLEKNKIAAANCRMKRQKQEHLLKDQSRELASKNTILKQNVSEMTQQLQELQSMLQLHVLSSGCYKPADIQEALSEQSNGYSLSSMSLCEDDESQSAKSLRQDISNPDVFALAENVADDWYVPDLPPLESGSPFWESLLPSLDLAEDLETTNPAADSSVHCDSVGV
jgi:hypothetical protein